jgi:SH3-like domain-containing protein
MKARVLQAYQAQYPDPISVPAGATVEVERRDEEFTGWLWCQASDGRSGWVPETILSSRVPGPAVLSEAYSARELTIEVGEEIECLREYDGWILGRNGQGVVGWFPAAHVAGWARRG